MSTCPECGARIVEYHQEPHYVGSGYSGMLVAYRADAWEVCAKGHTVNERTVQLKVRDADSD